MPHPGWVRLGTVAVLTPLLLWPTLLNHHPYLFWDSYGYFTQGRDYWQVVAAFLGLGPVPPEAEAGWIGAVGRMLVLDPAIRSVSYSLVFWPVAVLGGFWLTVAGFLLLTWPNPPWGLVQITTIMLMVVFPFAFFPFSKTLFLGFDLLVRPPEAHEFDAPHEPSRHQRRNAPRDSA